MRYRLVLALTATLCAQDAGDSRFAARSRLALVPVNVSLPQGGAVPGLEADDFLVLDNGRPQKATVDSIDTGLAPIALIVAVQSSGVSAAALEKIRKIGGMVQPLITGERGCAGLVSFAEEITWLQECTKDAHAFEQAFFRLRPGEHARARMLDAVSSAVEHLATHDNARRVLLLISETKDRGSEIGLGDAAVAVQKAGVTVYSITYSVFKTPFTSKVAISLPQRPARPKTPGGGLNTMDGGAPSVGNPPVPPPEHGVDMLAGAIELARLAKENTTEALAQATGGRTFSFTRQRALEEAVQKLGDEMHSQYLLSFAPQASAPGSHTIQVRLARPGEFVIRARPGYWVPGEPREPARP